MKGNRLTSVFWVLLPLIVIVALDLSPEAHRLEQLWVQARQAHRWQQFSQEAEAIRGIVTFAPWRADLWEKTGNLELASGEWQKAVGAFQTAMALGGLSPEGQFALGNALWNLGEHGRAAELWAKLMANGKLPVDAYPKIVGFYREVGDHSNAEKVLRNWLELKENDPQANYQLGLLLAPTRAEEALLYLQQVTGEPGLVAKARALEGVLLGVSHEPDAAYRQLQIGRMLGSLEEWDLAALALGHRSVPIPGMPKPGRYWARRSNTWDRMVCHNWNMLLN